MKANNRDVQRISNLAKGYERNLCGKDFLICYGEEGNTRMLEVAFSKKRFNHLVGIDIGRCHIKPWVLYKKALAGTLTPRDLGSSLSQYFPSKALAARMMNLFASSATHVSKVDPPINPSLRRDLGIGRCGAIRHRVPQSKRRVSQFILLCTK